MLRTVQSIKRHVCRMPARDARARAVSHVEVAGIKASLRRTVSGLLKEQGSDSLLEESERICDRVLAHPAFLKARRLAVYIDCPRLREAHSMPLVEAALAQGSRVYVPRVLDRDSNMHFLHLDGLAALAWAPPFGILEPALEYDSGAAREDLLDAREPCDMVIVPGLAFDAQGRRLGRGGGYYDKFLDACKRVAAERGWEAPLLVALSLQNQMVDAIPTDSFDVSMDVIVTATREFCCSPRAQKVWHSHAEAPVGRVSAN